MIHIQHFEDLGRFDNDWLAARYHFSFAGYRDPARMGVGPLLVWNDDLVQPGRGFDPHGHRDMEIITYVREGAISHEDHLGNRGRIEAGDVQVMSAGRGIRHSEYNLEAGPTRIFQIWIEPSETGLEPRWAQRRFPKGDRGGALVALASGRPGHVTGQDGALPIHQDAAILGATLARGQRVSHRLESGRKAYLVPARGRVRVNDVIAEARDGVTITEETEITITALDDAEILLADLP
ncbi:MAG: pirin family protein [Proteobacteria bacterium]|nr:pirin family protein [Pseudomonadota bacterium]